jgi:hypothetical protein
MLRLLLAFWVHVGFGARAKDMFAAPTESPLAASSLSVSV